jgi:hypothetical protein
VIEGQADNALQLITGGGSALNGNELTQKLHILEESS